MPEEVIRNEFTFTSADGETPIRVLTWTPAGEAGVAPKALVQIAHGMEEHIERYDHFARFLAQNGYAVCGNDHIGHGKSLKNPGDLSQLPVNGANIIIDDMHTLRTTFAKGFPQDTPYIIFGHSMGSFAARYYVAARGASLAGAVFCGTGQVSPALARFGGALARHLAKSKGLNYKSSFIHGLADGAYAKAIPNARTNLDWLNTDPAQVDAYIADPLCGEMFNVGGYATLMDLTGAACNSLCARAMPSSMKILFISGSDDPVGGAKGATKAYNSVKYRSGADVELKLYEGMRHEILNEPRREEVYADVLAWLGSVCSAEEFKASVKVRLKPKSERRQITAEGSAGAAESQVADAPAEASPQVADAPAEAANPQAADASTNAADQQAAPAEAASPEEGGTHA